MKPALQPLFLISLGALALITAPRASTTVRSAREGEDLSEALEALRERAGAPGVVALALQDGEIAAWGAAGVRAFGSEAPMTIDDPVHLGSCAKAITATLVARLIEDELLTWDTTIAQALPEFSKKIDEGFHGVVRIESMKHRWEC